MRFCPFCSAENDSVASECAACGRRLPPLPPRRQGSQLGEVRAAEVLSGRPATPVQAASPSVPPRTPTTPPEPRPRPPSIPSASRSAAGTPSPTPTPTTVPSWRGRSDSAPPAVPARRDASDSAPVPRRSDTRDSAPVPRRSDTRDSAPVPRRSDTRDSAPIPHRADTRDSAPVAPARGLAVADDDSEWSSSRPERSDSALQPPPTRTIERDLTPIPQVSEVPEVPEPGVLPAVRYTLAFLKARWQRRGAIAALREQIRSDTAALDGLLGTLGATARELALEHRAFAGETEAIDAAETRRARAEKECGELSKRQAEENSRFGDIEAERQAKVADAESALESAQSELSTLEAQRRGLRDKRKELERRQKGYLKSAEEREAEAGKQQMGDDRDALRRAAEELRRDAAALDPDRQDVERRIAGLEKPISQAMARIEGLKAELDAARRTLNDAREGHRHRLSEIEAEQGRKTRELAQAEAEIQRRLVTLGTLVNLNRVDRPEFSELYREIDVLRGAIGAASNDIDRFSSERDAFDKATLVRGGIALGGALVVVVTVLALVLAAI